MPRSTATPSTTLIDLDNNPIYPGQPPVVPPQGPTHNSPSTPTQNQPNPTSPYIPSGQGSCNGNFLINSFCKTDLDTEDARPNGGIPYSQTKDPTIYPSTTMRTSPIRGYFASSGVAASKFYQAWSSRNTYSDFMKDYI